MPPGPPQGETPDPSAQSSSGSRSGAGRTLGSTSTPDGSAAGPAGEPRSPILGLPRSTRKAPRRAVGVRTAGLVVALGLLLIGAGVLGLLTVWGKSATPSGGSATVGQLGTGKAAPPVDITQEGIRNAGRARVQFVDRERPDRLAGEMQWASVEPEGGGWARAEKPRAIVYLIDGRQLLVEAARGRLFTPARSEQPESGAFDGGVVITLHERPDAARPNSPTPTPAPTPAAGADASRDQRGPVLVRMFAPSINFNLPEARADAPGRFRISGPMMELSGSGLTVVADQLGRRLEQLTIGQTDYVRVALDRAEGPRSTVPAASRPASPSPADALASTQATAPSPTAATSSAPRPAPREDLYQLTLAAAVRATQPGRWIATADRADAWLRLIDGQLPAGAIAAIGATGGPGGAGGGSTGRTTPEATPDPKLAASNAAPWRSPPIDGEPASLYPASPNELVLNWAGPMTVRPLRATPAELLRDHVALRLSGSSSAAPPAPAAAPIAAIPARVTSDPPLPTALGGDVPRDAFDVAAAKIEYGATVRELTLAGREPAVLLNTLGERTARARRDAIASRWFNPLAGSIAAAGVVPASLLDAIDQPSVTLATRDGRLAAEMVSANLSTGSVAILGAGVLSGRQGADVAVRPPAIAWERGATILFQPGVAPQQTARSADTAAPSGLRTGVLGPIREARFDGAVAARGEGAAPTTNPPAGPANARPAPASLRAAQLTAWFTPRSSDLSAGSGGPTSTAGTQTANSSADTPVADPRPTSAAASTQLSRVQLRGRAGVALPDQPDSRGDSGLGGSLAANDIDLTLAPARPGSARLRPDVLLARGNVRAARSDGWSLFTDSLDAAFAQDPDAVRIASVRAAALPVANPGASSAAAPGVAQAPDIGPTPPARPGVELVNTRTGLRVAAQRLDADMTTRTVDLRGASSGPDAFVSISSDGTTVTGPQMRIDGDRRELFVIGQGTLTSLAPVQSPAPTPNAARPNAVEIAWTKSLRVDDTKGEAEAAGAARGRFTASDLERDEIRAERLKLTFDTARASTSGAAAPAPDAPDGGLLAGALQGPSRREWRTAEAVGEAEDRAGGGLARFESRRFSRQPDGSLALERLVALDGPRLVANRPAATLSVPGPGRLLVDDQRAARAPAPARIDRSPFDLVSGSGGASLFSWQDGLNFDRTAGQLTMDRGARLIHRAAPNQPVLTLEADRLEAKLRLQPRATAPAASGNSPDTNLAAQLLEASARGSVQARSDGRQLFADLLRYDAASDIIEASGSPDQIALAGSTGRATLFDPAQSAPIAARVLRWARGTNRIDVVEPVPVVVPR